MRATCRLPWRFGLFLVLCLSAVPLIPLIDPSLALMAGFDIAAARFLLTLPPLFRHDPDRMREHIRANNPNRTVTLLLTGIVMIVLLVLVASELHQAKAPSIAAMTLIILTLMLAWLFSNTGYALHYAYLFYSVGQTPDEPEKDRGGIGFPGTDSPDYWDFTYFAFTLGMTFQTSDVEISSNLVRRVVTVHCLAAFVFNLGILAFSINVLGSG